MKKEELLSYIGNISQIGGIRDITFNDGKEKGVRGLEVNTGNLCFTVILDRCLDIAQTFYKGTPVSWISKTGVTSPAYYEKEGRNFLRGFFGGLVTTCGLKNIGRPYLHHGLHGRISNAPAEKVSVFADWIGDEYVMKITGQMRECATFGENLVVKRSITAKLFSDEILIEDTVVNEGFSKQEIALCYHCNFGYPLLSPESELINIPKELSNIDSPAYNAEEEYTSISFDGKFATCGIKNRNISLILTYKTDTLPDFLLWKMFRSGDYVLGFEPRTTRFGGENIRKNSSYVVLKPFEEYKTYLKFNMQSI